MNHIQNPYIAGNPVNNENGFFGRQDVVKWVERELSASGSNVLVIRGQRRIGKTSLLLHLKRLLSREYFLPIYFDLLGRAEQPLEGVLVELAEDMIDTANINSENKQHSIIPNSVDNGRFFRREFLPKFLEDINPVRPVILLDEFDVLEELPKNVAANTFFRFLSTIATEFSKISFVISTGRDPADLSKDYSAIFKGALSKEVWVLDTKSAQSLVRQAESNNTLSFDEMAIDRILELTNCHPFLTQLLCQRLWQQKYYDANAGVWQIPKVNVNDVDAAVEDTLKIGELQLLWLWDGLSSAEKIYIATLASISDEGKSISEDEIIEALSKYADRFRTYQVESLAPQYLQKRNILEKDSEKQYRFSIELIRRWVKLNRPLQLVKNELDQSNMPVQRLFLLGLSFFEQQRWGEARTEFERSLVEDPYHLMSLIYLGETLIKQDALEEAIKILDRAYYIDPEETRIPLARALANFAQELYKNGDLSTALANCERSLTLSPRDQHTRDLATTIKNSKENK